MRLFEDSDWVQITNMLSTADIDLAFVCTLRDGNGMSVLHHACRLQAESYITRFIEFAPEVCNWPTYKTPSKPVHWTPLMCLVDPPVVDNQVAHNLLPTWSWW